MVWAMDTSKIYYLNLSFGHQLTSHSRQQALRPHLEVSAERPKLAFERLTVRLPTCYRSAVTLARFISMPIFQSLTDTLVSQT